tara:strand:+ start:352 stop:453 length:102 start_codon:yes stop_codon:yes gene_type:complete
MIFRMILMRQRSKLEQKYLFDLNLTQMLNASLT